MLLPGKLRRRLDPDFLDRISLITLRLPPLRKIRDEIPWLWETAFQEAINRAGIGNRNTQISAAHHARVASQLMQHQLPGNLRDLFRVAYRIIAARSDPHEPFSPDDSVEYGLGCLSEVTQSDLSTSSLSRKVAQAFAEALPLDNLIEHGKSIPAKEVERDLKAFMASEIRRIAKVRGTSVEASCDVSERTIRMWAKGDRKETSD